MGNEDTLSGFPVKEAVPALVSDERERILVSLCYCFILILDSLAFNGTQF